MDGLLPPGFGLELRCSPVQPLCQCQCCGGKAPGHLHPAWQRLMPFVGWRSLRGQGRLGISCVCILILSGGAETLKGGTDGSRAQRRAWGSIKHACPRGLAPHYRRQWNALHASPSNKEVIPKVMDKEVRARQNRRSWGRPCSCAISRHLA